MYNNDLANGLVSIVEKDGHRESKITPDISLSGAKERYQELYCQLKKNNSADKITRFGGRPFLNMTLLAGNILFKDYKDLPISDFINFVNKIRAVKRIKKYDIQLDNPNSNDIIDIKRKLFYEIIGAGKTVICP